MKNLFLNISIKHFSIMIIMTLIIASIIVASINKSITDEIKDNVRMLENKAILLKTSLSDMKYIVADIQKISTTSVLLKDETLLFGIPKKSELFYRHLQNLLLSIDNDQFEKDLISLKNNYHNFIISAISLSASYTEELDDSKKLLYDLNNDSKEFILKLDKIFKAANSLSDQYMEGVKTQFIYLDKIHISILFFSITMLILATLMINAKILRPISNISRTINKIDLSKDFSIRFDNNNNNNNNDELSVVSKSLNKMLNTIEKNTVSIKNLEENIKTKTNQIIFQSRNALMGEMISMIAHQWRQPLGAISSTVIGAKMQSELGIYDLSKENEALEYQKFIDAELDSISEFTETLTTTIDDFRNFYKPNKKTFNVTLSDIVERSLKIIYSSLLSNNIKIIKQYKDKNKIKLFDSEMMQVVLNILKNSQDNFKERGTKDPFIKIKTDNKSISISDNGGGIDEKIMDKIFDPYFSTKINMNGTGLGLYMSKTIVEEHHNGLITANNTDDGVEFIIQL